MRIYWRPKKHPDGCENYKSVAVVVHCLLTSGFFLVYTDVLLSGLPGGQVVCLQFRELNRHGLQRLARGRQGCESDTPKYL